MKFSVKAWSTSKGNPAARTGVFQLGNCPQIETPALLLSTRKGLPHFISPDLLPSLPLPDSSLLHVSPLHFMEGISSKTISSIGGLHKMLGLHDFGLAAVARDSIQCLPESSASNKLGASFETPCGRLLIKPAEYMGIISSLRPNLWATLADEVPAWVSKKRNKNSVDRTVKWLDECVALSPAGGVAFGAIVGGSDVEERRRCAQEVVKRNVSGYWIGGFGFGESTDERPALLSAVTGVAAGIDLFDSSYIYHLTIGGFALTFPLDNKTYASDLKLTGMGIDQTKINLKATVYRKDATPIVESCSCYTCQNHTKAYINHLLNVHEMLAQILLEIHNTHHYLGFFRSIREAIKEGRFEKFREMFVEKRRNHLAEVAVCA
ncbi:queuine tRNA-ribosyltransferase accessory subunit 2-like [Populus alba x Populus x berolinensis]|uniref:Queuine tRNA-ribosyltransferase accessory subunit 2 n=1 Tax=Populus alba x Populus x berolinensis TaxID=444605 RepID=A0AAD6PQ29_9ROSI|nr:queuine tRNA-ribosyltransferase accessory subunit 2-like [Populus alba x Populus x berolinensis]